MDTKPNLDSIRQKLESQRAILLDRVEAESNRVHAPAPANPDQLDLAQDYVTRARSSVVLDVVQHELDDVDAALTRLDDGTYGQCLECQRPINPERLEILPYAPLCMACQQLQERTQSR